MWVEGAVKVTQKNNYFTEKKENVTKSKGDDSFLFFSKIRKAFGNVTDSELP